MAGHLSIVAGAYFYTVNQGDRQKVAFTAWNDSEDNRFAVSRGATGCRVVRHTASDFARLLKVLIPYGRPM
jgi:uncharacterized protein (UPF0333 family)